MKAVLLVLLAGALSLGCATNSVHPLTRRASFDMQCPQNELRYIEVDSRSSGVVGCNKRAMYIMSCHGQGWNEECTWVLNGTVEPTQPAPVPQSGPPGQAY